MSDDRVKDAAEARRKLHEQLHPGVPFEGHTCDLCEVHDRLIAAIDALVRRRSGIPDPPPPPSQPDSRSS
jgi:hypothetical protein